MANRLTVVMVHPPRGNPAAQNLSAAVVGELIGLPGFDLTLVEPLDQIQTTSSDHLTLDSLAGDLALLAWQPAATSVQSLDALGIAGTRMRHANDRDAAAAAAGGRRIYAFDLTTFGSAANVCEALRQLLQSTQIRTYSLQGLRPTPAAKPAHSAAHSDRSSGKATAAAVPSPPPPGDATQSRQDQPVKPPLDLDDLVDQLDSLDP
jgi:hypothetical protein